MRPQRSATRSTTAAHASRVADIHLLGGDLPPGGAPRRDHLGGGRGVLTEEKGHVRPLGGEHLDDGAPDAAAPPGHDDRLAGQPGIRQQHASASARDGESAVHDQRMAGHHRGLR